MKDQVLATKDEVVIRDLFPIIVSNRRVYVYSGVKSGTKNVTVKRIIELEDITSVKYSLVEYPILKVFGVIFLILALGCLGTYLYNTFVEAILSDDNAIYLLIGLGVSALFSIIFFASYKSKRNKTILIEYPSNMSTPTKVVYQHISLNDFNNLVSSIFEYKDKLKEKIVINNSSNQDLEI